MVINSIVKDCENIIPIPLKKAFLFAEKEEIILSYNKLCYLSN